MNKMIGREQRSVRLVCCMTLPVLVDMEIAESMQVYHFYARITDAVFRESDRAEMIFIPSRRIHICSHRPT